MDGPGQPMTWGAREAVEPLLESRQIGTGGSTKNENFLQPLPFSSNGRNNPFLSSADSSLRGPGFPFSPQAVAAGNDLQRGGLSLGVPQVGAAAGSSLSPLPTLAPAASLQNGAAAPDTTSTAGQISIFVPPTNTATLDASLASLAPVTTPSITTTPAAIVVTTTRILGTTIFPGTVSTAAASVSGSALDSQPTSDGLSSGTVAGAVAGALVCIAVASVLSILYYRRHASDEKITLSRFLPWRQRKTQDPESGSYTVGRSYFKISKGSLVESEIMSSPHFEEHPISKPTEKTVQTRPFQSEIRESSSRPPKSLVVGSFSRPLTDSVQRIHTSPAEKLSAIASAAYIPPPKPDQVGAGSKTGIVIANAEVSSIVKSAEVKKPKLVEIIANPAQPTVLSKKLEKTVELQKAEKSRENTELDKTVE